LNAFRRRAYGSIFAAPFLFACASPRMVPPPEIAQGSQILDAQNRSSATGLFVDESFNLGSYKISKVDRKMTKNSSLSVNSFTSNATSTGYSYAFGGGQGSWKGRKGGTRRASLHPAARLLLERGRPDRDGP
jgi:hypothetical protein